MSITRCHCSGVVVGKKPNSSVPALLTRIAISPIASTAALAASRSVTSSSIAWPFTSPAIFSAPSTLRSPTHTSAPSAASRSAIAAPIPLAPPVTSAFLPSSRMRRSIDSRALRSQDSMRVALLAGGTGGAKLAAGLQEELGAGLTVIANTADDIETLGVHVSPDPDLVGYWLSGEIDEERGWSLRDDTFTVMQRMADLGAPNWFSLSDRDLAACLYRAEFMRAGGRQTDAQAQITRGLGIEARVLPMTDEPVRTKVITEHGRRELQEYLILDGGQPDVLGVELEGIEAAAPTSEVVNAFRAADLIIVGPSNPVISIGPILAVPGMREALGASVAPVVAVSPYVGGEIVKGPTNKFMAALGRPGTAAGVASLYAGLIDAMVVDESGPAPAPTEIPTLAAPTLMDGAAGRVRLARTVLDYGETLIDA